MADEPVVETSAEETPATPSTPEPQAPQSESETPPVEPVAETPAETPAEPAAEAPPEPKPAANQRPGWDPERQKRDEERARKEKERDDELARLKQTVEELKAAKSPPAPKPPTDDELATMADQIALLRDPANEKYDEVEAAKLEASLRKETLRRQVDLDKRLREREEQDAAAVAEARYWTKWQQDHPEHDAAEAKKAADAAFAKYADRYSGNALSNRVAEVLEDRMDDFKKAKPSPTPGKSAAQVKTAPPASVSAPAGTRVIPKDSGARQTPMQLRDSETVLTAYMRQARQGE